MRWEVDYTEDDIMDDLDGMPELESGAAAEYEQNKTVMMDYLDQYYSQFIEQQSPKKENQIKWFYQQLAELAFVNSGRAILKIDDKKKTATLKYMGKSLSKTGEINDKTGLVIALIFYTYDFVSIDHEGEYFSISIYENLFDHIKVDDKSAKLDQLRDEIRRMSREKHKQQD